VVVRLLLLACAGIVIQLGWTMVWALSYHLTHGNDFTYTYLETQPVVWERLQDLLLLANVLAPGLELPGFQGPVSRDIIVNSLVMAFVVRASAIWRDHACRSGHLGSARRGLVSSFSRWCTG
jgi:hypothetical protein